MVRQYVDAIAECILPAEQDPDSAAARRLVRSALSADVINRRNASRPFCCCIAPHAAHARDAKALFRQDHH